MGKKFFFAIIRFYQKLISPILPKNCRFWPSCSEYSYRAVEKYGLFLGFWKSFRRILRCYPWHPGGIDLP
ncbi:MAG: membrane protein insertion efficiency factor YidD [Patescibacteria group bacterium]